MAMPMKHRRGFTLIEVMITVVMVGVLLAVMVPRLRTSNAQLVYEAARQVAYDVESVRSRSMATASSAEIVFDAATNSYKPYLDTNQDGVFAANDTENAAIQSFRYRALGGNTKFGMGNATAITAYTGTPPVTFAANTALFDSRGLTSPVGTRGVLYITSTKDANQVAAVTITGAANVRIWRWQGGAWK
jgi:prepilin-type N-terminal cleavage/methylation domain-containing protein